MKKTVFIILFIFIITLSAFSSISNMSPEYWVGTWLMVDEDENGNPVERVWVIERDSTSSKTGKLTTYMTNGKKDLEFTWEFYTDDVYLLKIRDIYLMYYVFYIEEEIRRLRAYDDVHEQFELHKISNSQSGFPKSF